MAWLLKSLGGCRKHARQGSRLQSPVYLVIIIPSPSLRVVSAIRDTHHLLLCRSFLAFCCGVERFAAAVINPDTLLGHGVRWTWPAVGSGQPYALGETVAFSSTNDRGFIFQSRALVTSNVVLCVSYGSSGARCRLDDRTAINSCSLSTLEKSSHGDKSSVVLESVTFAQQ